MANKERVQLLVDALRSGDYTQGAGWLENKYDGDTRNCCLGVACRVAMNNGLNVETELDSASITVFDGSDQYLPESVRNWFEFDYMDPGVIDEDGNWQGPAQLNDGFKYDFEQIAAAFERTYIHDNSEE